MRSSLSRHASTRCQQRGIPLVVVDWLLQYGRSSHDHRGAEVRFFDKKSRRQLAKATDPSVIKHHANHLDAYAVVIDGQVITVGHRHKHIHRF